MVIKGEDMGAAGTVKEGMVRLFRGNGGRAGGAWVQTCLISQLINLDLPQG